MRVYKAPPAIDELALARARQMSTEELEAEMAHRTRQILNDAWPGLVEAIETRPPGARSVIPMGTDTRVVLRPREDSEAVEEPPEAPGTP